MTKDKKPAGYWNRETCAAEALKYNTVAELMKGSNGAYRAAKKGGYLIAITKNMQLKTGGVHWTRGRCAAKAKQYGSSERFKARAFTAYNTAKKKGWLSEFFPNEQ
ncbi:hypothetical protein [Photobacterium angustum]|uniref:hypothetical protein n=1 Tax=Photobacterium angustum TaxID=661 RepID=UPI0005DD02B8|nr:hypothetical protein [Photobacterium angustum]KJG00094.1 hypothetical protein UB35_19775 [Photobacterium angustum]PSV61694.1 hypothetical protein CTM95_20545 [Photobacterium angustum]